MPRKYITDRSSQLKKVRGLYKSVNRIRYEQEVVEGPQAVRELLVYAPETVRDVYATETALALHADLDDLLLRGNFYTHILPEELFSFLSTDAQGVLAVAHIADEPDLEAILQNSKLLVFALQAADPGNLGTIIRSADAFGIDAVITGKNSVAATNPKVIRASAGSVFHIPIIESEELKDFIDLAHSYDYQILVADSSGKHRLDLLTNLALTTQGEAQSGSVDLRNPTVWLVGNEAHGFSDAELALADAIVSIPMWGNAESLNVATATALCLYSSAQAQNSN